MRGVPLLDERFRSALDFGVELGRTVGSDRKALTDLANAIFGTSERRQLLQRLTGSRARVRCGFMDASSDDK